MKCPAQPEHGALVERKSLTPEQAWCGKWFDCTRCMSSVLLMSDELKASHAAMVGGPQLALGGMS